MNAELQRKFDELAAQQAATAVILKVIASSPSNAQPVFDTIAESANRLLGGIAALVTRVIDDEVRAVAITSGTETGTKAILSLFPTPLSSANSHSRVAATGRPLINNDIPNNPDMSPEGKAAVKAWGFRSLIVVPMLRNGTAIGTIGVSRPEAGEFSTHEIKLLETFADQAVIAIENARLFKETKEALERQTATADVLRVIASSPTDVQPVFDAIAERSNRLIGGHSTAVYRFIEQTAFLTAFTPVNPEADAVLRSVFPRPLASFSQFKLVSHGATVQIADYETADVPEDTRLVSRVRGFRSCLLVPLLSDHRPIGLISVTRKESGTFAEHDVNLLKTFADQAVIAIENVRLFDEVQARTDDLRESLQQQTATAEVLKVISGSPGKIEPVFDKILASARHLCDAKFGHLLLFDGETWSAEALHNVPEVYAHFWNTASILAEPETNLGRVQRSGKPDQVTDVRLASGYLARTPLGVATVELGGARTLLTVPLLKEGKVIGGIALYRTEVRPFDLKQVELLSSFADQAVIAIQNARLFQAEETRTRELTESLQQQTATADVLKVISRSVFDLQPVLDSIVETASRLCEAEYAFIYKLQDDDKYHMTANHGADQLFLKYAVEHPLTPGRGSLVGRTALERKTVHMPDCLVDPEYVALEYQSVGQYRSNLGVPLLREGVPIGVIILMRAAVRPFTERQIELVTTFADQAVIAIENARLFNETREALEQQKASADILAVISSSVADAQPVFDKILVSCKHLFGGDELDVLLVDEQGQLNIAAYIGDSHDVVAATFPAPVERTPAGRAIRERRVMHWPDLVDGEDVPGILRKMAKLIGYRSMVFAPMLWEGRGIGAVGVARSTGPFKPKELAMIQTFADQAVIAIQNARLFNETKEALERQTATADVLQVISRSAFDLGSVMNTLTHSAAGLCKAEISVLYLREGDVLVARGVADADPAQADFLRRTPLQNDSTTYVGRTILAGAIRNIADVANETEIGLLKKFSEALGFKSILFVPLMREGRGIGVFALARKRTGQFTQREVALVQTFADQAVIAVENVRLFDEVQARTRDLSEALTYQTGTSSILSVIASSPTDVAPVLQAIVKSACELCGAYDALVRLKVGDELQPSAHHGPIPASRKNWHINRNWTGGRAVIDRKPVHVHDVLSPEGDEFPETQEIARQQGYRTSLSVPLLREGESIGAIVLRRIEMHPFSDKQIALLQTFADQAVIAIGNVRMFEQVRQRTDELSRSLDELRAAQERLIQTEKLASLGQLTAGIAHEIKNPLNFVNNFSALSAQLTDELNDVLKPVGLERKVREEVNELTGLLKDNLQKVVQHGKRADSIVKNMLLHSREGSGDHRPADINALLDESLNLAYHGARAEKPDFNVTLQRDFDETAGAIELFPQEITRAFLNLIANGFYAVTKRKTENGEAGFEPALTAVTRNLGDTVEIRIRDNGTGIPAEVLEKMFNPFFTTKPAGEGTGLGLSMTHDIIVKQHGGKIDIETVPGAFTEFTVVLPRKSTLQSKKRGQS